MSSDPNREEAWPENPGPQYSDPAAAGGYDPGAAYVEEGQDYGATETGYYDAEGNYVDPAQAYYDPNAGQTDAAYYEPPAPELNLPPVYSEPAGVYDEAPAQPEPAPAPAPVSRRPAKKAPKKKVAHRNPQPKLSTPRAGSGYRKPVQREVYGGGISFATVLMTLVALAMLGAAVMAGLPMDLSAFKGRETTPVATEAPRNLLAEAQKVMIDRNADIVFTEEEVNRYLSRRLQGVQKGMIASIVKYRGAYVDLTPGKAEVVIEREVFGKPITMSVTVTPEVYQKQVRYLPTNWTLGRISLGERNVKPVIELFRRLRVTLGDEYEMLRQMTEVRFEEDRVVLDSRL